MRVHFRNEKARTWDSDFHHENSGINRIRGREISKFANTLPREKYSIPLSEFEDRRIFHPEGSSRPETTFRLKVARLIPLSVPRQNHKPVPWNETLVYKNFENVPYRLGFENPARVLVCVRRAIRRQVLFSKGVAGSKGLKKYRRTASSNISCF